MSEFKIYRCLLVGNGKVGKTTFLEKIITGRFNPNYYPTIGINNTSLFYHINKKNVIFHVFDIAGLEANRSLGDNYFLNADCVIIMLNKYSSNIIKKWKNTIENYNQNIPFVVVINNFDKQIPSQNYTKYGNNDKIYLSNKNSLNLNEPFIYLYNQLETRMWN